MSNSDWVHLDVAAILAETDSAILVVLKETDEQVWLPRSQICDAEDYRKGDRDCTVSITRWLAEQRDLA